MTWPWAEALWANATISAAPTALGTNEAIRMGFLRCMLSLFRAVAARSGEPSLWVTCGKSRLRFAPQRLLQHRDCRVGPRHFRRTRAATQPVAAPPVFWVSPWKRAYPDNTRHRARPSAGLGKDDSDDQASYRQGEDFAPPWRQSLG